MTVISRYRSRSNAGRAIGLSVSYERENLLARGLGLEHLRELLLRLARPLLRNGASLAFGGHWREAEDNFTFDLLRLISAEQEDNSLGGPDTNLPIGRLYNHSPWPGYLAITPRIEAEWINCCRIVRITQQLAGILEEDVVPDEEAFFGSDRAIWNAAIALSAMRRLGTSGFAIDIPDLPSPETVPPIMARVILGGKLQDYSGFLPGIFEEALVSLESKIPLFVLGGFGGAAEVLANTLSAPTPGRPNAFTIEWHTANNPKVAKLETLAKTLPRPAGVRTTKEALDALFALLADAKADLAAALNTGLSQEETLELLATRDMGRAVQLVQKGMDSKMGLATLPA